MYIKSLSIRNHPYLGNQNLSFINPITNRPYSVIAFVGENASGKTTMLDLIFNYNSSEYITNNDGSMHKALFIRQNSIHAQAEAELVKAISGNNVNPLISGESSITDRKNSIIQNCAINNSNKAKDILNRFNDPVISASYKDGSMMEISCGGKALESINGKKSPIDISKLSSGQQELLIKISNLENILNDVDCVLFDEPETSLHPRWQRTIVKNLRDMLENNGEYPQIFIATHSEKVLESLINKEDVLIYKFSKENGRVDIESLENMPLCLPCATFSEINYIVFNIPSYDYHNQLIARLGYLTRKENMFALDKYIYKRTKNVSLLREWVNKKHNNDSYKTLPIFIRNYYHHPIDGVDVSEEELVNSIIFLRALIKDIVDKEKCVNM